MVKEEMNFNEESTSAPHHFGGTLAAWNLKNKK